jgi:hypothetical protein
VAYICLRFGICRSVLLGFSGDNSGYRIWRAVSGRKTMCATYRSRARAVGRYFER